MLWQYLGLSKLVRPDLYTWWVAVRCGSKGDGPETYIAHQALNLV